MAHKKLHVPLPFEAIMQRHEREIMRYLLRVTSDPEDAADLFQETWLRAYRAYPRLEPESDARPWLYAIASNLCRNRARDGARRARVIVPDNEESTAADAIGSFMKMKVTHRSYTRDDFRFTDKTAPGVASALFRRP